VIDEGGVAVRPAGCPTLRLMEVSVEQAATRLGVTPEAVRARLRNGRLRGRQVRRGRRNVWRVNELSLSVWERQRGGAGRVDRPRVLGAARLAEPDQDATPQPEARDGGAAPGLDLTLKEGERDRLLAEIEQLRRQVAVLGEAVAALARR